VINLAPRWKVKQIQRHSKDTLNQANEPVQIFAPRMVVARRSF